MLAGDHLRRGVAEFVGTFALILVGGGAALYGDAVGIPLATLAGGAIGSGTGLRRGLMVCHCLLVETARDGGVWAQEY